MCENKERNAGHNQDNFQNAGHQAPANKNDERDRDIQSEDRGETLRMPLACAGVELETCSF